MHEAPDPHDPPKDGEGSGRIEEIRELRDGVSDGLEALAPLDLRVVRSADDLVRGMARTAFAGRQLGEAADILEAMVRDPDCTVVMTLSGAMTIAKLGLVVCDMIDDGWVQAIVSTGALMAHGFVEATGRTHFKYDPSMDDKELYEKGYDRVYDTLELEQSLDDVEHIVHAVMDEMEPGETYSSADLHRALGRWLAENTEGRGILRSAYEQQVPIYVPAFTDSELGLDVRLQMLRCRDAGVAPAFYDGFLDVEQYVDQILAAKDLGIFTVGGGVPRNWAQQAPPYLEIVRVRLQKPYPIKRFRYGIRLCPEPVHWGGLSGCTYSEGVSWGKFVHPSEGGRYAEVLADATVTWPLIVMAVQERLRDA